MIPARRVLLFAVGLLACAVSSTAQTVYHLHKEPIDDFFTENCSYSLQTVAPNSPVLAVLSNDLKNQPLGVGSFACFETFTGVPAGGTIPNGSTVTVSVKMKKTTQWGVIYPRAILQLASGTALCSKTGTDALSASFPTQPFTLSCNTSSDIPITTADRPKLYIGYQIGGLPGNHTVKVELDVEGTFDHTVTVPNPVTPTPTITGVDYTSAPPNTDVLITGTNFAGVTRSVTFGGTAATTADWTATSVRATVPATLAPGPSPYLVSAPIRVIVQGAQSGEWPFSAVPPPTLTSLTPSTAHTTDTLTISGQNFLATQAQGSSTVKFNNITASPTSWNNTTIQLPVPPGQTTGTVIVTVANRSTTTGLPFTLIAPPSVTALYPTSGQVGALVTIVGQRFGTTQGTSTITFFNGTTATPTQWSDTVIKTSVPAGATTGPLVVKVSNQPSPDAAFTVLVAGSMSGAITRVTGGTAISSASVQAVLAGVVKGTATTAADGSYSIAGLDPGSYDVRVFKAGFSPELRTGQTVTSANAATVNVAMYVPGSSSGKVTQIDGVTPLVGAAVTVYDGPTQKGTTNTNATGDYTVGNLHPGSFTVQAANVGYRTQEQTAAVAESAATTTNFSLDGAPAGPVRYEYDELGRLVQVTDPSGDSAIYRYDAVGNITAIERPGANVVSISDFTPNGGAVGAAVTIHGAGFSTTPSLNVVKFNGIEAVVTSATATQIATTVPVGASDGTIAVTVSTITGTSPTAFDVTSSSTPTVSGFTPTSAAAGTAVTVNGTNFETVASSNNLRLNLSPLQVASATPTAIQTTVPPSATTGRVSVATPNGTAVSTDYLWIAPPPYLLPALVQTTAAALDSNIVVSAASEKIALLAFEGTEGQRVAIQATVDQPLLGVTVNVHLYTPFGAVLKTLNNVQDSGFLDTTTLRWTGTYSVVFDPLTSDARTGTLEILNVPADVTGPITFGTALRVPPLPAETLGAGQNARLTFTGTAGHRVGLSLSGFNCQTSNVSILAPGGTAVATTCDWMFLETPNELTVTGIYTLLVDPKGATLGSGTLTLHDVSADITGPITFGAALRVPPLPTEEFVIGQNARLTFTGTAGHRLSLDQTGFNCFTASTSILAPGGAVVATTCGGTFIEPTAPLAVTGTYTVLVDPKEAVTGSTTLTLYDVPADAAGTLTINNPATAVSFTPGQNGFYTFTGSNLQAIKVILSTGITGTLPCATVSLLRPNGTGGFTELAQSSGCGGFDFTYTLPADAIYTIKIDPIANSAGSATVRVISPP